MFSQIWAWLLSALLSTALIGATAYLLRDTIGKFFTKAVEHRFEKKLETFKAGIRDSERELDQIRSFLASARKDRDSAIQSKRLEAAEALLRTRNILSQFSMLVEYMKIINTEQLLKEAGDPKIATFIEALVKPFNIDEKMKLLAQIDRTIPRLYLSDKSLKAFDVYEGIIFRAITMMKLFSIPLKDKGNLIKYGSLNSTIIELVPRLWTY
ncbi:hypothetical protein [Cypionkella psychrotolerans]|uniref:hypothetical protein n=1 Tax=Cypionkella psychrotolerans TaxID=1678131 RepID=UPI0006B4945D|nr:hypothetical protein [Cypionkella psychrotolerans]